MVTLHPKYLVDGAQKRESVLLPLAEWERIIEELEDLDDLRAFDAAKAGLQEAVPFEQAVREIQEGWGK